MGIQTVIALFFATLFKWNKISSAVGVWISNPFTAPFLYSLTYYVGAKIMGLRKVFSFRINLTFHIFFICSPKRRRSLRHWFWRSRSGDPPGFLGLLVLSFRGSKISGRHQTQIKSQKKCQKVAPQKKKKMSAASYGGKTCRLIPTQMIRLRWKRGGTLQDARVQIWAAFKKQCSG